MDMTRTGRDWPAVLIATGISIFLFQTAFLALLFLVPLQILHQKKGFRAFGVASAAALAGMGILRATRVFLPRVISTDLSAVLLDLALPALMLMGLLFVNIPVGRRVRKVTRMLAATAVVGLISIPVVFYLTGNEVFRAEMKAQVSAVWNYLLERTQSALPTQELSLVNIDTIVSVSLDILFSTYLFSYFAILALNWRIGTVFAAGVSPNTARPSTLMGFSLSDRVIWALLVPWAVNFMSLVTDIGPISYLFWNIGLIVAFLYGLQGLGIVNYLIAKYAVGRGARLLIIASVVLFIIIPGANVILLIGIPLLGISEVWIKYRKS